MVAIFKCNDCSNDECFVISTSSLPADMFDVPEYCIFCNDEPVSFLQVKGLPTLGVENNKGIKRFVV